MSKLVEIDCCMDCPHREQYGGYDTWYGISSTCNFNHVPKDEQIFLFKGTNDYEFIHSDCPLPDVEDED